MKPATLVLILSLWCTVAILWHAQESFASQAQVEGLDVRIKQLDYTVRRTALEALISQKQAELYSLQQSVADLTAAHRPVDRFYGTRIFNLGNELEGLKYDLANLK